MKLSILFIVLIFTYTNTQASLVINDNFTSKNVFSDKNSRFHYLPYEKERPIWKEIVIDSSSQYIFSNEAFSRREIGHFAVSVDLLNLTDKTEFFARFKLANFKNLEMYVIQDRNIVYESHNFANIPFKSLSGLGVSDKVFIPKGESKIFIAWSGFNVGVFSNLTIWMDEKPVEAEFQFLTLMALGMILGLSFYHLILAISDKSLISLTYVFYGVPVVTLFLTYQGFITDLFGIIDAYGRIYCVSFLITGNAVVWLVYQLFNAHIYLKRIRQLIILYSFLTLSNVILFIYDPSLAITYFEPMIVTSWFLFVGTVLYIVAKGVRLPPLFLYLWCPIMASLGALTIFSTAFQNYYSQELSYILLCSDFFVMSLLLSSRVRKARQAMISSIENRSFVSQLSDLLKEKVMPKAKKLEVFGHLLKDQGMIQLGSNLAQESKRFQNTVLDLESASFNWVSNVESFSLNDFLTTIQQQYQYLASQKAIRFYLDVRIDSEKVELDRRALQHILTNLLSNALRHTKRGYIKLLVTSEGNTKLKIEVIDTGPGVDTNTLQNLFTPFSSSSNSKPGSHGIGLYICQRILSTIGGNILYKCGAGGHFVVAMPFKPVYL